MFFSSESHHKKFHIPGKQFFILLIPFCVWIVCLRDYFLERLTLEGTAPAYYYRIKYFLDSIVQGVYPGWTPFSAWGSPDLLDMRVLNDFNPLHYLILFFKLFGLSFYQAYLAYMASYYWIGLLGFYLLAREVLEDKRFAYAAYAAMMFSSLGLTAFTENLLVYMFVSGVWFFYFLIKLIKIGEGRHWLGLTFSAMIIFTTYLPFYFLTIFMFFLILFGIFYYRDIPSIHRKLLEGVRKNKCIVIFCGFAFACSLLPGVMWYTASQDPQYLMNFGHRHSGGKDFLTLDPASTDMGGITGPLDWHNLFSNINIFAGRDTFFFFIPVFLYLLVPLTLFNKANRKSALLFSLAFALLLISLAEATPVYPFLNKHIYFFRFFRNLFFLLYLAIPIIILFLVDQLRLFSYQKMPFFFIAIVHLLAFLFLWTQGDAALSSYATIVASLIFFLLLQRKILKWDGLKFLVLLTVILLIQPVEIFYHFTRNAERIRAPFRIETQRPQFSFERPSKEEDLLIPGAKGYASELKWMRDRSGFVDSEFIGMRKSYDLQQSMDFARLQEYTRYKFLLCQQGCLTFDLDPNHYSVIKENSPQFEVLDFGLNHLKLRTNFHSKKFLIYNDSFHPDWRAWINGKPVKIELANDAFKGIWLEAGENIVEWRFGNFWLYIFYFFLIILMIIFLAALLFLFFRF